MVTSIGFKSSRYLPAGFYPFRQQPHPMSRRRRGRIRFMMTANPWVVVRLRANSCSQEGKGAESSCACR